MDQNRDLNILTDWYNKCRQNTQKIAANKCKLPSSEKQRLGSSGPNFAQLTKKVQLTNSLAHDWIDEPSESLQQTERAQRTQRL